MAAGRLRGFGYAAGAIDASTMLWRASDCATSPDAFASSTKAPNAFAAAGSRLFGKPIARPTTMNPLSSKTQATRLTCVCVELLLDASRNLEALLQEGLDDCPGRQFADDLRIELPLKFRLPAGRV